MRRLHRLKFSLFTIPLLATQLASCRPSVQSANSSNEALKGRAASGQGVIPSTGDVEWHITVASDLKLDERICWSGFTPDVVLPEFAKAIPFAHVVDSNNKAMTGVTGVGIPVKDAPNSAKDNCVRIAIDLDAMASALDDEAEVEHVGSSAIYGSFDPWLWHPQPWPTNARGRLYVSLAPDVGLSLPHAREADGAYIIPFSTWTFMARFAIGRGLAIDERDAAGTHLSIVTLPGATTTASQAGIRRFIEGAAAAVATIDTEHAHMATDRVQVLLRAGGQGRRHDGEPVQFGMAIRGGGPAVTLRISPTATDDELYGEWVTVHELAHLWLPPVERDGAWISEGFASYYQCILRSRVGMYDDARGWDELTAGFERGQRQAGTLPLKDAQRPRFQHIYWGGAAIALKLDVLLRKRGSSLDAAVTAVRRSMTDLEDRSAEDMVRALWQTTPRASEIDIIKLVRTWLDAPFPSTKDELTALGVIPGNPTRLLDEAPLANIRKAISARR